MEFTSIIRLALLVVQVLLVALTVITFYYSDSDHKFSAGFWLVVLALNFWLIYMAASTGSIV